MPDVVAVGSLVAMTRPAAIRALLENAVYH